MRIYSICTVIFLFPVSSFSMSLCLILSSLISSSFSLFGLVPVKEAEVNCLLSNVCNLSCVILKALTHTEVGF